MENVASFLQYGSNFSGALMGVGAIRPYEPTETELKEKESQYKRQQIKDLALCTISTAEKLVLTGLDVDTAFARAEELVEKSKLYLAQRTEAN